MSVVVVCWQHCFVECPVTVTHSSSSRKKLQSSHTNITSSSVGRSSKIRVNTACECVSEEEKGQPQQKARRRANSGRSRANFPVGPLTFPWSRERERSKKYPVTFVRGQSVRGARGQNVPADSQKKKNLDDDQQPQQQQSVGATRGKQRTRRSHPLVVCARECE